jgi:hypothetical protein
VHLLLILTVWLGSLENASPRTRRGGFAVNFAKLPELLRRKEDGA